MVGPVGAERPTDPATSREFANLLTKVAPDTQSLCVSAPGDEVSLITLELKVCSSRLWGVEQLCSLSVAKGS